MGERQLMAFIASYTNGTVIDESEIMDEKVGSDPLTWEVTKSWRKAKTGATLMEIFASNDQLHYMEMLTNLIRDYNQRGCTTEVTNLTAFKTETEEVYSGHPKGILPYVKRFHSKYKSRGFPTPVDFGLVIKDLAGTNSAGALKEEVNSNKKLVNTLQGKVDSLASKVNELKKIVDQIPLSRLAGDRGTAADRPVPKTFKCGKCGMVGDHWTNRCPSADKKEEEEEK